MINPVLIADSSPLIALAIIEQLELLPRLYRRVLVPPAVWHEVTIAGQNLPGAQTVRQLAWVDIQAPEPQSLQLLAILVDRGEAEAIALAQGIAASTVLLDDAQARRVAERLGIRRIGTLGILRRAKRARLLNQIKPYIEQLSANSIYMRQNLIDTVLRDVGEMASSSCHMERCDQSVREENKGQIDVLLVQTRRGKTMINALRSDLESGIDPEYKTRVREHFNMDVSHFLGVRTPLVRKISGTHFRQIKSKPIDEVLGLCEQLLQTGLYEYKIIAFDWSYRCRKHVEPKHFIVFEQWLKQYVNDWSDCDDFCTHTLGFFLLQHPAFLPQVKTWTSSESRWMKRAAAVSLIYGLRRGDHLQEAFEVAKRLFRDEDDLVRKGCGWMLKEASKSYPEQVLDYVLTWREAMPRVTLRYAVERFAKEERQKVLKGAG